MNVLEEFRPIAEFLNLETIKYFAIAFSLIWVSLEIIFAYIIIGYVGPYLQRFRKPVATETPPLQYFTKIFDTVDSLPGYTISDYIRGFFHGVPMEDIHRENLASFIAWGIFGKHIHELDENERFRMQELLDYAADRYEDLRALKPGHNPNISHCAITLEPVRFYHRPLFFYVASGFGEILFHNFYLRMVGFQFLETEGMTYWIKEGSSSLPPLLIYHGISSGWSMYSLLIRTFHPHRTVILADLDAVKIKSMYFHMPSMEKYNNSILRVLRRHRIDKVSIVGHSFGSITASWLVMKHPEVVSHVTLLDPVSILLCLPDVVENFIYRSLHQCRSPVEAIIWFFAAREITISYALHRNFIWHNNILWLQDLSTDIGVVIGIATKDEITNPRLQQAYIDNCVRVREAEQRDNSLTKAMAKITTVVWQNYSHGQVLLVPSVLDRLREIVHANEKHALHITNSPLST